MAALAELSAQELYNWLSTDDVVLLDVRDADAFAEAHVRGAYRCWLGPTGDECICEAAPGSAAPQLRLDGAHCQLPLVLYADEAAGALHAHAVHAALASSDSPMRELRVLAAGQFEALLERYGPVACAGRALRIVGVREGHSAASRLFPSEVLPGKLFLTDLPAAAQLAQRADVRAQLKLAHVVTIMAELPSEMAAVVARAEPAPPVSGAAPGAYQHTFFACHDASGADIKQHFAAAHALIDEVAERGGAVLVHCSKGVSRSATLCISYLMRSLELPPEEATARVRLARRIVCPNEGFSRCLLEFDKERRGGRSGVYVPKPVVDGGAAAAYALPPRWAARQPLEVGAELLVLKGGVEVERVPIGQHVVSEFGRSVTADVPCEHASISRRHCALVQHAAGGFCAVDLGSTHGTFVNGVRLLPHAEVRFAPGDALVLGASSRSYALALGGREGAGAAAKAGAAGRGGALEAEVGSSDDEDGEDEAEQRALAAGAQPRAKRKRKWEKKAVRRMRSIVQQRALTENERVAMRAGMGSGCFGPG